MPYDVEDTIVAIASAPGGGARGVVRLSGPRAVACAAACWTSGDGVALSALRGPRRITGTLRVVVTDREAPVELPGQLLVWPDDRSFTRQPSVEFHTVGSPPLLTAAIDEFCRHGARPAHPGEFTLRAFLGGRIDLTQAEAVMSVVDARSRPDFDRALDQLAGGLSRPLHRLREQLLGVLAELEAGLDFAEEPIEFIGREELRGRLARGQALVAATLGQLATRDRPIDVPRVVLTGLPNAGKSSLFNALAARYGDGAAPPSIVSPTPGATRDFVVARLDLDGVVCDLIDLAGDGAALALDGVADAAQFVTATQRRLADVRVRCVDVADPRTLPADVGNLIAIATKVDLVPDALVRDALACSSTTGEGIDAVAAAIRRRLAELATETGGASATAARAMGSLREAARALGAAHALVGQGGDELLAAEIRIGLQAVGEVVGAVCADDVLDRVFSQFCIGK